MVFPAFSARPASSMAAHAAAPEEMPTSTPSFFANQLSGGKGIFVGNGNDLVENAGIQYTRNKAVGDFFCRFLSPGNGALHALGAFGEHQLSSRRGVLPMS